jgi:hypothetical protein
LNAFQPALTCSASSAQGFSIERPFRTSQVAESGDLDGLAQILTTQADAGDEFAARAGGWRRTRLRSCPCIVPGLPSQGCAGPLGNAA